ncbi:unnamed protein product [Rotaria socialis]
MATLTLTSTPTLMATLTLTSTPTLMATLTLTSTPTLMATLTLTPTPCNSGAEFRELGRTGIQRKYMEFLGIPSNSQRFRIDLIPESDYHEMGIPCNSYEFPVTPLSSNSGIGLNSVEFRESDEGIPESDEPIPESDEPIPESDEPIPESDSVHI